MSDLVKLESSSNGLGTLTLGNPDEKITVLSHSLMDELEKAISQLESSTDLRGLVIRGLHEEMFAAGADIKAIENVTNAEEGTNLARKGQLLFDRISRLSFPTVAAIGGPCLGGGLELVLACDYRVAADSSKTKIGLPEVRLGILPGFGGTQRLPRTIGLPASLGAMLTGRMFDAQRARKMGIVDAAVPPANLFEYASRLALGEIRKPRAQKIRFWVERNPLARKFIAMQANKKVMHDTLGFYPAPLKIIESAVFGLENGLSKGLIHEARLLGELIVSPVSKSLTNLFFLSEKAKRHAEPAKDLPAIKDCAVIGCGVMGGGMAMVMANKGLQVRLRDLKADFVARAVNQARKFFDSRVKRRRMKPFEMQQRMDNLVPAIPPAKLGGTELVIEAVAEKLEIKQAVFREVATEVSDDTILATNTSSLSVTAMQEGIPHPERVVGIHFFNPVEKMPLVEIIRGEKTSPLVIARSAAFAQALGKTVIVVKDVPGFLVNRILAPYLNEAARLLLEGVSMERIEVAARTFMPMGPFALIDEVGIDIANHAGETLYKAYGERMEPVEILARLLDQGRLGKKNGKGFYKHHKGKKKPDPRVVRLLSLPGEKRMLPEDIAERLAFPIINEALRCLEERVVDTPGDLDLGSVMGIGFAPFHGGVLRYAESLGSAIVLKKMAKFRDFLGIRFEPAPLLQERGASNSSFYS